MTDKKIKLEDIIRGEWKNLPEDDRKFVEYVCLKKFAALRKCPDDGCKTDDDKIKYIIGELYHHYRDTELVKEVLNRSFPGVTVILNPDVGFLCEHPRNEQDLLYNSPEENRTLTIEVVNGDEHLKSKDGHLVIPPTHNADFVAIFPGGFRLWIASRDDYQIAYEFDLYAMFWDNK